MDRRQFVQLGLGSLVGGYGFLSPSSPHSIVSPEFSHAIGDSPTYSVIPVVGDGKWIWKEPPKDQTGYLESRKYQLDVGIRLQGTGNAKQIRATTPVPIPCPEQEIENYDFDTQGCKARLRKLADGAIEMVLSATNIRKGQVLQAVAHFDLTLKKQYFGFQRDQFTKQQKIPRQIKQYLYKSPGINKKLKEVHALANKLKSSADTSWDLAKKFHHWVHTEIKARPGNYTSVKKALKNRVGDCEEKAAVFVALCRAMEIPARLVWVPNHNWAEFYLTDEKGKGHWIPAHTSCYSWFGWTGAHELVIQKGDRVKIPHRHKTVRLQEDWAQWSGRRPKLRYLAELKPIAATAMSDAGPGHRIKNIKGQWLVSDDHQLNKSLRDGELLSVKKK